MPKDLAAVGGRTRAQMAQCPRGPGLPVGCRGWEEVAQWWDKAIVKGLLSFLGTVFATRLLAAWVWIRCCCPYLFSPASWGVETANKTAAL